MRRLSGIPDWRDAAAYAELLELERPGFAWEWLRRDPGYRAAAAGAVQDRNAGREDAAACEWGLHAFEDPDLPAPQARPVWTAGRCPFVLRARAEASDDHPELFDLRRFASFATLLVGDGVERLLLSDGSRGIRLDVSGAGVCTGPVRLHYDLQGFASAEPSLLALRRLIALVRTGRYSKALHPLDTRARRHLLVLRTHDALREGATQREIAAELFRGAAAGARWRIREPSVRSRAQRLTVAALRMAYGGYWSLLA